MIYAKTCPICNINFQHDTMIVPTMVFCSIACQRKSTHAKRIARAHLTRMCPRCGETKPGTDFSSGTFAYCRPCGAAYARELRASGNPAEQAARRRKHTLGRYGLTPDRFDDLLQAQGSRCAICRADSPGGNGIWQVDHDHTCCNTRKTSCGKCIRGLLCTRCNIGLGNFGDDPETLESAATYLREHTSSYLRS